jgi:hypothetical protein
MKSFASSTEVLIFRVIFNLVNCELKTIFILLPVFVPFFSPISTPRAFFSDKQRNRALMRGRQPGLGGMGGEERD